VALGEKKLVEPLLRAEFQMLRWWLVIALAKQVAFVPKVNVFIPQEESTGLRNDWFLCRLWLHFRCQFFVSMPQVFW